MQIQRMRAASNPPIAAVPSPMPATAPLERGVGVLDAVDIVDVVDVVDEVLEILVVVDEPLGGDDWPVGGAEFVEIVEIPVVWLGVSSEIIDVLVVVIVLVVGFSLYPMVVVISRVVIDVMSFRSNTGAVGTDSDESGIAVTRYFLGGAVSMDRGS
jgi:hypothetical protein